MARPKGQQAEHVHGPDCHHDHGDHDHGDGHHHAGPIPYRRETPKPGRNDPCFCGSGRKFKKCHGAADAA
jgi:SEC-C motif